MASLSDTRLHHARIKTYRVGSAKEKAVYISNDKLVEYLDVRSLEGLSDRWSYIIKRYLQKYLVFCNYKVSRAKTIDYLKLLQQKYSQSFYRKQAFQLRRFLEYIGLDYMKDVKIISEPDYEPVRVSQEIVESTLEYFKGKPCYLQMKALIYLGASTGMRPYELYKLTPDSIDLENRRINVGRSKTSKARTVFFDGASAKVLRAYLKAFEENNMLTHLFGMHHVQIRFKNAPLQVKQLRKFFIQQWHRNNGNYLIGEVLLGHSVRSNVTLQHYATFNLEEIQKEYDRVVGERIL